MPLLQASDAIADAEAHRPGLHPRDWVFVAVLTVSCLVLVGAAWSYYLIQARELENSSQRTVFSVAEGKARQIANWRAERLGDGDLIASVAVIEPAKRLLSDANGGGRDRREIRDVMSRLSSSFLYSDVMLVDAAGAIHLRLKEADWGEAHFQQQARASMARTAIASGRAVLADLTRNTRDGKPRMALLVPVEQQGAFILEIDPERFLYPYLGAWAGSTRTAETLMVRLENGNIVDLSPRRYAPDTPLLSTRHLGLKVPSEKVLDAGWSLQNTDYRNVRVIATVRHIPGSPWYLISKIDLEEVTAPIRRIGWEALFLTGLIALVNASGGALVVWHRKFRLQREREVLFFAISNETPALLWTESASDGARFMNRPLREFLGGGRWWMDAVHPSDRARMEAECLAAVHEQRAWLSECSIRRADSEYRITTIQALPQLDPNGGLVRMSGSMADITDRRRAEDALRVANASLDSELKERIRKEEEVRNLSARLIGAREEERTRLARELHDGLSQQIAAVSIGVANLKRSVAPDNPDARAQSDRIHQKLVQLADSVRSMSHDLHPPLLTLRGLGAAVEACCDEVSAAHGLSISRTVTGQFDELPQEIALNTFRIVQEGLQNAIKHSGATSVSLRLTVSAALLVLCISDTGVGFDPANCGSCGGFGLLSMRERARLIGGTLEIRSAPNRGTELKVMVPLSVPAATPVRP